MVKFLCSLAQFPNSSEREFMMRSFPSGVLALALAGLSGAVAAQTQRGTPVPTLLGSFATQLSPQDVGNLEAVLPVGAKPWLLVGGSCNCSGSIAAYLPPTTETKELRRGRFLVVWPPAGLIRGGLPTRNTSESWKLTDISGMYAQLAASDGRFEQPESVGNLHGLSTVVGEFDDGELLSIINFVRSNSRLGGPIENVSRSAENVVQVQIPISPNGPRRLVRIRREGQSWVALNESIVFE